MRFNYHTFGHRSWHRILRAPFQSIHYAAFFGIIQGSSHPIDHLKRYIFGSGDYPCILNLRTPIGEITPKFYFPDDIQTLNEIFYRKDYPAPSDVSVVLDIGSNIGLSALYFLTRNAYSKCYLYEPNPNNVEKLKLNLKGFEERYFLKQSAVYIQEETLEFQVEETGRYGGLVMGRNDTENYPKNTISVKCEAINQVLENILNRENCIDIIKIDTEGNEVSIIESIHPKFFDKIKKIYFEKNGVKLEKISQSLFPTIFRQYQYGETVILTNKNYQS